MNWFIFVFDELIIEHDYFCNSETNPSFYRFWDSACIFFLLVFNFQNFVEVLDSWLFLSFSHLNLILKVQSLSKYISALCINLDQASRILIKW
jgi:hypothetical protein